MAAAAVAQLMGGSPSQIEYAAEMGLEHHLGLTCDPVSGLVQIPCIERNAYAAARAMDAGIYALYTDGRHMVSFDQAVSVMKQTGHDLPSLYKETSEGGLAKALEYFLPYPHEIKYIVPDILFAYFIEDLMAHGRINGRGNIHIPPVTQILSRLVELLLTDHDRIILS